MGQLIRGSGTCTGHDVVAPAKTPIVVFTGGPGGGKTAVLEMARRMVCAHVAILPEAASVIFGGGFPREDDVSSRRAMQRAIYFVQREMERLARHKPDVRLILVDRGTVDGVAYWPNHGSSMLDDVESTIEDELARYIKVIHLEVPEPHEGYNNEANPLRIETNGEARVMDRKIATAWSAHPHRVFVDAHVDFLTKANLALNELFPMLPSCCALHKTKESVR